MNHLFLNSGFGVCICLRINFLPVRKYKIPSHEWLERYILVLAGLTEFCSLSGTLIWGGYRRYNHCTRGHRVLSRPLVPGFRTVSYSCSSQCGESYKILGSFSLAIFRLELVKLWHSLAFSHFPSWFFFSVSLFSCLQLIFGLFPLFSFHPLLFSFFPSFSPFSFLLFLFSLLF